MTHKYWTYGLWPHHSSMLVYQTAIKSLPIVKYYTLLHIESKKDDKYQPVIQKKREKNLTIINNSLNMEELFASVVNRELFHSSIPRVLVLPSNLHTFEKCLSAHRFGTDQKKAFLRPLHIFILDIRE